jgi:hypothetical protein
LIVWRKFSIEITKNEVRGKFSKGTEP